MRRILLARSVMPFSGLNPSFMRERIKLVNCSTHVSSLLLTKY
jgi:hypothetical protein